MLKLPLRGLVYRLSQSAAPRTATSFEIIKSPVTTNWRVSALARCENRSQTDSCAYKGTTVNKMAAKSSGVSFAIIAGTAQLCCELVGAMPPFRRIDGCDRMLLSHVRPNSQ